MKIVKTEQIKRAMALIRVSSLGQEGNTSRQTQESEIQEHCSRHDLELLEIVAIVESARSSELRTQYAAFMEKADRLGARHLVFHRYDREARNLTDTERNEKLVREGRLVLHYVIDGKILDGNSPDSEFFNRDIQAAINKNYSRELSSKVVRALQAKAEMGWYPSTHPPLGYITQKLKTAAGFERRRGAIVIPNPDRRAVRQIQREFELRAETPTPSLRDVRNRIIAEGLIPVEKIKNYHIGSVEKRLKNLFYNCKVLWNGSVYEGKHERIIAETLFWKVQKTFGTKTPYLKNPDALFGNGWIKCAEAACGSFITFDPKTKKIKATGEEKTYRYYRCSNGRKIHTKLKSVSEESVMGQLSEAVKQISIRENFRNELLQAVNKTLTKAKNVAREDLDRYEAAQVLLKDREDQLYDHFAAGAIDLEIYNGQRKRLQAERLEYTSMMKIAQAKISDTAEETVESLIELATNAESLWNYMTNAERRELLGKLLSNRWLDGVTVRYEIVKPLRTLSEMKENSGWRRERDSNSRWGISPNTISNRAP